MPGFVAKVALVALAAGSAPRTSAATPTLCFQVSESEYVPFEEVALGLLEHAPVTIVMRGGSDCGFALEVFGRAEPLSDLYQTQGSFGLKRLYTGARVTATIRLRTEDRTVYEEKVWVQQEPPERVSGLWAEGRTDPEEAPLMSAFDGSSISANDGYPYKVAKLIGQVFGPEVLISTLGDTHGVHDRARRGAAAALAEFHDKEIAADLVRLLGDSSTSDSVLWVLARSEAPWVVDLLIHALRHRDPRIRRTAAIQMFNRRDERAIDPLIDALADEDREVRKFVARALEETTGEDFGEDSSAWRDWRAVPPATRAPEPPNDP